LIHFRRTVADDLLTISGWIQADPGHLNDDVNFWLNTGPGVSCYALGDETGVVMFVRQETEGANSRLHVQFAPFDRKRIVRVLREGYPLVAQDAKDRGFHRIVFSSESPALIRTMLEMGFKAELAAEL
jgi:hypothetical protein